MGEGKKNKYKHLTPPQDYGFYKETFDSNEKPILKKRDSKPKVANVSEEVDSSPTPIFELGYKAFHARIQILSSRLKSQAFVFKKHPLKLDLTKAAECEKLADECDRMAERILNWPNLTAAALAGEKSWMAERYMEIMDSANELSESKIL